MPRILLLMLVLGFAVPVLCQPSPLPERGDGGTRWTIGRCVNRFTAARVESTKVGYQYWFADKAFLDGRTLKLSVVRPGGATHPPHAHVEDELFFVLEGTAEFFLDGDSAEVGPMTSLYCPPDSRHGIRNIGKGELKYLVIKKYPFVSQPEQQKP